MQADARLVQHVRGVDQRRAQRVGQRDALRLAARQRAGGAIERQVGEPDVVQETRARARLAQHGIGDLVLGVGERRARRATCAGHAPASAPPRRWCARPRAPAAHPAAAWLPPQSVHGMRAADTSAGTRGCTACTLLLQRLEEREDAGVRPRLGRAAAARAPRPAADFQGVSGETPSARANSHHRAPLLLVARRRPRVDRALAHRAAPRSARSAIRRTSSVGAEPVARGAGAARIVEREQLRRRRAARACRRSGTRSAR